MIKLDEDIHGLAHISELGARDAAELRERFKIGQKAEFEVISIEPSEHRLGLKLLDGAKQNTGDAEKKENTEVKEEKVEKKVKKAKKEEKIEEKKEEKIEEVKEVID